MKTTKPLFRFLLPAFLCLMFIGTEAFSQQTAGQRYEKALYLEEVNGKLQQAIDQYQLIIKEFPTNREIVAKSMLHIGICSEKLGLNQASENYRAVISKFPEQQSVVTIANQRLSRLDNFTSESRKSAEETFKSSLELFQQANYSKALAGFEKVRQMMPKSDLAEEAQFWIGQCQFKDGNYPAALIAFETILKDYPKSSVVPVTELMIAQTKQASVDTPKNSPVQWIDDKTMLDPRTGIKYSKINTISGENDIIDFSVFSILQLTPNRKFALHGNKIIPFDNSEIITVSEDINSQYRLSPDGALIAWNSKDGLMVSKFSPESGTLQGNVNKVADLSNISDISDLVWSPDQKSLLLLSGMTNNSQNKGIYTASLTEGSIKLITKVPYLIFAGNVAYSRNGKNIIAKSGNYGLYNTLKMFPASGGKSLTLFHFAREYRKGLYLSPDDNWIYTKRNRQIEERGDSITLYRVADQQNSCLPIPPEAGSLIGWSNNRNKVLSYRPSFDLKFHLKVVSPYGGPSTDLYKSLDKICVINSWSPDGKSIIAYGYDPLSVSVSLSTIIYPIDNQPSREFTISGIQGSTSWAFSPDYTKIVAVSPPDEQSKTYNLLVYPFSLQEGEVTAAPKVIFTSTANITSYTWSPDGTKVAVTASGQLWVCPINEMKAEKLGNPNTSMVSPTWSPDGRMIMILPWHKLDIINVSDGIVIKSIDSVKCYACSPDKSKLSVAFENGQLFILAISNWEAKKLTDWSTSTASIGKIEWSPDGKFLAFNGYENDARGYGRLFVISSNGGKITELAGDDFESKDDVKWSPDSKWIAYDSWGSRKMRPEGTLWEADLTQVMNRLKPGKETGFTTETDINALAAKMPAVKPDGTFTDARDGRKYTYKKIGEQTWMAENLAYLPLVHSKNDKSITEKRFNVYGYDGTVTQEARKLTNYTTYGVLYNWPAAMNCDTLKNSDKIIQGICPNGWHLPSDTEWVQLEIFLGMDPSESYLKTYRKTGNLAFKLRSAIHWNPEDDLNTGSSGFEALPGGLGGFSTGEVQRALGTGCYFWTSTGIPNKNNAAARFWSGTSPVYRNPAFGKSITASIRCIKDK